MVSIVIYIYGHLYREQFSPEIFLASGENVVREEGAGSLVMVSPRVFSAQVTWPAVKGCPWGCPCPRSERRCPRALSPRNLIVKQSQQFLRNLAIRAFCFITFEGDSRNASPTWRAVLYCTQVYSSGKHLAGTLRLVEAPTFENSGEGRNDFCEEAEGTLRSLFFEPKSQKVAKFTWLLCGQTFLLLSIDLPSNEILGKGYTPNWEHSCRVLRPTLHDKAGLFSAKIRWMVSEAEVEQRLAGITENFTGSYSVISLPNTPCLYSVLLLQWSCRNVRPAEQLGLFWF